MVWILNGIWHLETPPFEIRTNHLKSGQKCPGFEWSGFQTVGTKDIAIAKARPFENGTIWKLDHLKSNLQKVRISNGQISDPRTTRKVQIQGFYLSSIQMPGNSRFYDWTVESAIWICSMNYDLCCERVIAHDVVNWRRTQNVGERIFTGAELHNGIVAVDNNLYVC